MPRKAKAGSSAKAAERPEWWDLIPGYDPTPADDRYRFDLSYAQPVLDFFEHPEDACLRHVAGPLAGEIMTLAPWQRAIIGHLYGWVDEKGLRRYRECFVLVPRKNGKTTLAAGLIGWELFCSGEKANQIYSAAGDREQASLLFQTLVGMIMQEPALAARCQMYKTYRSIEMYDGGLASIYKAISADAGTKHGYNSGMICMDEVHTQRDRELFDVLKTSQGSRAEPLFVGITTADFERQSICNELHDYARQVRDGDIVNDRFLPVLFEAPKDADIQDPEVWAQANPNLGVSVRYDDMEEMAKRALDEPTFENTFKRLRLNIRTEQDVRWLQMHRFDECGAEATWEGLKGQPCYLGLDLSANVDITALALCFPRGDGNYSFLFKYWVPKERARERERKDKVPYLTWANQGLITLIPGEVIDHDFVQADIEALAQDFRVVDIAIDRWNATNIAKHLEDGGLDVFLFGQGFADMSAPTKMLENLFISGKLDHGGCPVFRWMCSNVTAAIDPAGNVKPDKKKSTEKIDGVTAAIMALGRAMVGDGPYRSVYEDRGLRWA